MEKPKKRLLIIIGSIVALIIIGALAPKDKEQPITKNDLIQAMFSPYDGHHYTLEGAIKKSMKNPKSYEHVETQYKALGDSVFVVCTFRGTNSFNAIVPQKIAAISDLHGNILSIEEVQ